MPLKKLVAENGGPMFLGKEPVFHENHGKTVLLDNPPRVRLLGESVDPLNASVAAARTCYSPVVVFPQKDLRWSSRPYAVILSRFHKRWDRPAEQIIKTIFDKFRYSESMCLALRKSAANGKFFTKPNSPDLLWPLATSMTLHIASVLKILLKDSYFSVSFKLQTGIQSIYDRRTPITAAFSRSGKYFISVNSDSEKTLSTQQLWKELWLAAGQIVRHKTGQPPFKTDVELNEYVEGLFCYEMRLETITKELECSPV